MRAAIVRVLMYLNAALVAAAFVLLACGGVLGVAQDYSAPLSLAALGDRIRSTGLRELTSCFPPMSSAVLAASVLITAIGLRTRRPIVARVVLSVLGAVLFLGGGWLGGLMLFSDLTAFRWNAEWLGEAWPLFEVMFAVGLSNLAMVGLVQSDTGGRSGAPPEACGLTQRCSGLAPLAAERQRWQA